LNDATITSLHEERMRRAEREGEAAADDAEPGADDFNWARFWSAKRPRPDVILDGAAHCVRGNSV
jgi:hypothetical protein